MVAKVLKHIEVTASYKQAEAKTQGNGRPQNKNTTKCDKKDQLIDKSG